MLSVTLLSPLAVVAKRHEIPSWVVKPIISRGCYLFNLYKGRRLADRGYYPTVNSRFPELERRYCGCHHLGQTIPDTCSSSM